MENFNLGNVENVTYDGKEVHEVKLDGTSIWKFTPKEVTGLRLTGEDIGPRANANSASGLFSAFRIEVTLHWDAVPGATSYEVKLANNYQMKNTGRVGNTPNNFEIYNTSKTSLVIPYDSPVLNSDSARRHSLKFLGYFQDHTQEFYLQVKSNNMQNWPSLGKYLTIKTPHMAYDVNLSAVNKYKFSSGNAISVKWKLASGTHNGMNPHLERRVSGTNDYKIIDLKEEGWNSRSYNEYIDVDVVKGKTYSYTMVDIQNKGKPNELRGLPSDTVSCKCDVHKPMEITFKQTNKIVLPIWKAYTSGYLKVDWGDGTFKEWNISQLSDNPAPVAGCQNPGAFTLRKSGNSNDFSRTYPNVADRTIKIYGELLETDFDSSTNNAEKAEFKESNSKLSSCSTFGDLAFQSIRSLFKYSNFDEPWLDSNLPSELPSSCINLWGVLEETNLNNSPTWDTRNVRVFRYAFAHSNVSVIRWNLEKASDLYGLFYHAKKDSILFASYLPEYPFEGWGLDGPSGRINMDRMFNHSKILKEVKFQMYTQNGWNTSYLAEGPEHRVQTSWMFDSCPELVSIHRIEEWNVKGFHKNSIYSMFGGTTTKLTSNHDRRPLNLSKWCMPGEEPVHFGSFGTGPWYDNASNRPKWNCS